MAHVQLYHIEVIC